MKLFANKKGFVIEGVMVMWAVIALVIGGTAIFAGPKLIQAVRGNNQNVAKQVQKINESGPVIYRAGLDKNGEAIYKPAGNWKKSEEYVNVNRENPPETWMQKFFGLGLYAILICAIIGGIIYALGAWPFIKAARAKLKTKLEDAAKNLEKEQGEKQLLTEQAEQIVISVDAGLKTLNDSIVLANTSALAVTDAQTKTIHVAVAQALEKAKKDFLLAMKTEQDSDTEDLVTELLKND